MTEAEAHEQREDEFTALVSMFGDDVQRPQPDMITVTFNKAAPESDGPGGNQRSSSGRCVESVFSRGSVSRDSGGQDSYGYWLRAQVRSHFCPTHLVS